MCPLFAYNQTNGVKRMKMFLKYLWIFYSLPKVARGAVYADIDSLAVLYGIQDDKTINSKSKIDSPECKQSICNGTIRKSESDDKGKTDSN